MLTIGITTFQYRFEKYFLGLLDSIKKIDSNIEIYVAINGEHKQNFNQEYRKSLLYILSKYDNVYPVMFPEFRGLTKLWNSIIVNSSSDNEYVLLLNDDVSITSPQFIEDVKKTINNLKTSFKINGSWSHVVIKKDEIDELGYFPELFLGIGEEDGQSEYVYEDVFKRPFKSIGINGIINHVDMTHNPTNTLTINTGKYSKFNQDIMYNKLFKIDNKNGLRKGICPANLIYNEKLIKQYPYEKFFKENKDKL